MDVLDETLSAVEREALTAFVERVRERYGERLAKVAVFGSRARGDVHAESDIDVAVILRAPCGTKERFDIVDMACDVALAAPAWVDLSPRVLAEDDYLRLVRDEWHLGLDIEREGIPL
jgi:predicted nucleotidyltransferase